MNLQNPAGLWLLLGIPVVVFLWLLKPPHNRQPVSSSYIWRLSDLFVKRRLSAYRLRHWLTLLVRVLLVACLALIAARPSLRLGPRIDYIAILDASASMRWTDEAGVTRFERAARQIGDLSADTAYGHTVSVLLAAETPRWLIEDGTSRDAVEQALAQAECGWGGSDLRGAMTIAQLSAGERRTARVLMYTDQTAVNPEGFEVVSFNDGAWNVSVTRGALTSGGCEATLLSSGRDATVHVGLQAGGRILAARTVRCLRDQPQTIRFDLDSPLQDAELLTDGGDAFSGDDRWVFARSAEPPCDTLIVSDQPLYLSAALSAIGRGRVDVLSTADYAGQSGYHFYIFDHLLPGSFPSDGDVWIIHPDVMPDGLYRAGQSEEPASVFTAAILPEAESPLLRQLQVTRIVAANRPVLKADPGWQALLEADGSPVFLTQVSEGHRLSVLAFDLHESNLPMLTDFIILIRNLLRAAVPSLLEETDVDVGQPLALNPPESAASLRLTGPDGTETMLSAPLPRSLTVDRPGVYVMDGGAARFSAHVPAAESAPQPLAVETILLPEPEGEDEEATAPFWPALALAALLLLLAEWSLYHHERV